MKTYRIAGININSEKTPDSFAPFLCDKTDLNPSAELFSTENIDISGSQFCTSTPFFTVLTKEQDWIFVSDSGNMVMRISSDYKTAQFRNTDNLNSEEAELLFRIFVECQMILNGCLSLHSSCVEKDGEALCFSGVSGTGKSTRAAQWVEHLGFTLLSGDRPGIIVPSKQVCGVPWDGKEHIHVNKTASLKGIYEIVRSDETYVQKISASYAYKFLAGQIFVPMWDSMLAAYALVNLRKLTASVPAYRLFCGPDEISAGKAYDIIFNNPERIISEG